ncbi:MAG: hypothetical protein KAI39_06890 [Desulfobulbaceae bacterium]|nr:hypothetical protein [Desulfobulbaceae bacterium]
MNIYRMSMIVLLTIPILLLSLHPLSAQEESKKIELSVTEISVAQPAHIQQSAIQPGLDVVYYTNFFKRHLRFLPEGKSPEYPSFRGKPITHLNHQFGKDEVFGSGKTRGIGMRMTGYLHLTETGIYEFQALSNDGIILRMSGQTVLSDPVQHSDKLSNIGRVTVETAGWYPVILEYFQRKGTAALKLFWKTPDSAVFFPVPEEMFGHIPTS